jgi:hypothetical protein
VEYRVALAQLAPQLVPHLGAVEANLELAAEWPRRGAAAGRADLPIPEEAG